MDGRPVRLPASKPRALLAVLLLNRNRVVPTDALIDALWEDPPETASKALQGYVSQVRRAVGAERVETKPPGYVLRVDPGELDLETFEALAAEGRERLAAGDAETAAQRLRAALELWRGPPLAEFDDPFARESRRGLEEVRLATLEARIDADLARGRHDELVPELEQLVAREPYRERPRAQLMLALYRAGRQADALEVYRRTRETLTGELGIEPAKELQELEQAILRHDPVLDRPTPPPRLGGGDPEAEAPRRRRLWAVGALAAVIAAALVIAFATTNGGSKKERPPLRPFVAKLENFLVQSRDGRREVASAVRRAGRCTLPRSAALVQLRRVQRNRQSLLDQIAALSVPDDAAAERASDSLQRAIQRSIRADGLYSDWLAAARGCPPKGPGADLRAAHAADTAASRAKRAFVADFNPLARRFGQEVWAANEF